MAKGKYEKWLEPENLILIEGWARDGLTDEQIAYNMGISVATLYNWKKSHLEILESLKKGKEVVDTEVENALLKRALGYSYDETTSERKLNEDTGKYELITTKVVIKQVVPDTTAQIFWLKNRRPDKWRDKQKEETDTVALDKLDNILNEIKNDAMRSSENVVHE